jgi:hypothetical protein
MLGETGLPDKPFSAAGDAFLFLPPLRPWAARCAM